jgi:hypothetical protein
MSRLRSSRDDLSLLTQRRASLIFALEMLAVLVFAVCAWSASAACVAPRGMYCGSGAAPLACPTNNYCDGGAAAPVPATYFAPGGDDSGAGTEATPLATLGPAIVLSGGGLIVALAGTYSMCGWAFSATINIAAKEGAAVTFNACRLPLFNDFLFIAITLDSNGLDLYSVNGELRDCVIRFASAPQGGGARARWRSLRAMPRTHALVTQLNSLLRSCESFH